MKGAPGEAVVPPNKGCILEFSFMTSGIDEALLDQKIQVFPNPTELGSTNLSINLGYDAEVSITLYDITGQMISTVITKERGRTFDKRIDMSRYQPGNYFLKVNIDGTTLVKKWFIFRGCNYWSDLFTAKYAKPAKHMWIKPLRSLRPVR